MKNKSSRYVEYIYLLVFPCDELKTTREEQDVEYERKKYEPEVWRKRLHHELHASPWKVKN